MENNEEGTYKEIVLYQNGIEFCKFIGKNLATVEERYINPIFGKVQTILDIFLTEDEQYVCVRNKWHDSKNVASAIMICNTLVGVVDFFGISSLAKALYAKANLKVSGLSYLTMP